MYKLTVPCMILYYIRYSVVTPVLAAAFYTSLSVASVFAVTLCFLIQSMGMHIFPGMGSPWCFFSGCLAWISWS